MVQPLPQTVADAFFRHQTLVFVSPHPDDVVWSCGGLVARAVAGGANARVVVVFDGGEDGSGAPSPRIAEDRAALKILRAERHSLGLTDAALRQNCCGQRMYPNGLALRRCERHPDDAVLEELTRAVPATLEGADAVIAPLARQTHIDHVLTRHAIEANRPPAMSVYYYQEFPYPDLAPGFAHERADIPVDTDLWLRASQCYRSQISATFGDPHRLKGDLLNRATARGARRPACTLYRRSRAAT